MRAEASTCVWMQRFSKHMHFVLHLIIPIQLIGKIHNLHRCLTKLGEGDCTPGFLLLPLSWAQHVHVKCAACYSEAPVVGGNLESGSEVFKSQRTVFHTFFFLPSMLHTQSMQKGRVGFEDTLILKNTDMSHIHNVCTGTSLLSGGPVSFRRAV